MNDFTKVVMLESQLEQAKSERDLLNHRVKYLEAKEVIHENPRLGIKKLSENAVVPQYQTAGASGFDLSSSEHIVIPVGEHRLVKTGLAMEIPNGFEVQIRSRSGLAFKRGIQSHFGTIDSDYKGEIGVILFNFGDAPFDIAVGDRIAQAVISPVVQATIVEVEELSETERGDGGFGSTGL